MSDDLRPGETLHQWYCDLPGDHEGDCKEIVPLDRPSPPAEQEAAESEARRLTDERIKRVRARTNDSPATLARLAVLAEQARERTVAALAKAEQTASQLRSELEYREREQEAAEQERDALIQEREHPFDASEFKALHHRAVAAEARVRDLREALEDVLAQTECKGFCSDAGCPFCGGTLIEARRALQATQEDGAASALTNSEARPACSCSWMTTDGVPSRIPSLSCAAHADSEARGE